MKFFFCEHLLQNNLVNSQVQESHLSAVRKYRRCFKHTRKMTKRELMPNKEKSSEIIVIFIIYLQLLDLS